MPDILQVGPFMVRGDWVAIGISGILGIFVMSRIFRKTAFYEQPLIDKSINSMLIILFSWKLSPLLLSPSLIRTQPFAFILLPGSAIGIAIGTLISALYMDRQLRKMGISRWFYGDLLSVGGWVSMFIYSLLSPQYGTETKLPWGISIEDPSFKYHPVHAYTAILTGVMLVWRWKTREPIGSGWRTVQFLTYYPMGLMVISLFKPKQVWIMGLSVEQIGYVLWMMAGYFLAYRLKKKHNPKPMEETL